MRLAEALANQPFDPVTHHRLERHPPGDRECQARMRQAIRLRMQAEQIILAAPAALEQIADLAPGPQSVAARVWAADLRAQALRR